jgi:hypothetical protein
MVMSVATPRRSIREAMLHGVLGGDGKSCYYYHGRRCGFYAGGRCGEGLAAALGGVDEELAEAAASRKEGRKNVLVLFSDTGGGHRASAEAIRDAFRLEFGDVYRVRVAAHILILAFCCLSPAYIRLLFFFFLEEIDTLIIRIQECCTDSFDFPFFEVCGFFHSNLFFFPNSN